MLASRVLQAWKVTEGILWRPYNTMNLTNLSASSIYVSHRIPFPMVILLFSFTLYSLLFSCSLSWYYLVRQVLSHDTLSKYSDIPNTFKTSHLSRLMALARANALPSSRVLSQSRTSKLPYATLCWRVPAHVSTD